MPSNQGADTIVTYGAVQSNHARQTAAACAQSWALECHLLLSQRVDWDHLQATANNGNVLFNNLFGAHSPHVEHWMSLNSAKRKYLQVWRRKEQTGLPNPPRRLQRPRARSVTPCALAELECQTNEPWVFRLEQISPCVGQCCHPSGPDLWRSCAE